MKRKNLASVNMPRSLKLKSSTEKHFLLNQAPKNNSKVEAKCQAFKISANSYSQSSIVVQKLTTATLQNKQGGLYMLPNDSTI